VLLRMREQMFLSINTHLIAQYWRGRLPLTPP